MKYFWLGLIAFFLPLNAFASYQATGSSDPGTNGCYTLDIVNSPHNGFNVYTNSTRYIYVSTFGGGENFIYTAVDDNSADYRGFGTLGDYTNTWTANGQPSPPTIVDSTCGEPRIIGMFGVGSTTAVLGTTFTGAGGIIMMALGILLIGIAGFLGLGYGIQALYRWIFNMPGGFGYNPSLGSGMSRWKKSRQPTITRF